MSDRSALATAFLAGTSWATATRAPLAGDASARRYERLTNPETGQTAVLMDAPPEQGETVHRFVELARHLRAQGLSAPEILAEDPAQGFLLIEDLGDDLFTRVIARDPTLEAPLYEAATDLLVALRDMPLMAGLDSYGPALLAEKTDIAFDHYVSGITGDDVSETRDRFIDRFGDLLHQTVQGPKVLILRDYHAENLIWLPDRSDLARVGLLDFQDAVVGHPAYDLVSLLQDIRRDVPARIEMPMIARFIEATGADDHEFRTAYAVLGVQRNLRILGVFARLSRDLGKTRYLALMAAVWRHVMRDLEHPAMAGIADLLRETLPPPSSENLARLHPR
ncbi:phosphotransferase [Ruegeria pomeroyi]|nr:phosphotransferase [Ruegeria pomeroyi]NVK96025.1 phosphotransferase [Ruegeria pomeroyi]NVK99895.1 phosphotransferase [Ruegeria pomeroyi]QWV10607.1 phosphotransferase [Ruegeria pomeroyi]HCE71410.1 aminoglycoside phosphotransferase [Ruegeria sp.]